MRMMEILRKVYQKDRESFIAACYRELLGREPDPGGMQHHLQLLGGKSKLAIMTALLQSPEAEQLYRSGPPPHTGKKRPSAADLLRKLYTYPDDRYVRGLYEELLCRRPDHKGASHNVRHLQHGASRASIAAQLLHSGEAVELLKAKNGTPIAQKILFDYANRTFYPDYHY
ncbi:DUF4214 domain-containing protein [Paenibacillus mesophilus]|nr:DUF4214 domain-containing protein [Paenibacillus mesophilus]